MEFAKKHLLLIVTAVLWLVGIVLGFCIKQTESIGGLLIFAAFVLTIVCIVKKKKASKNPLPESLLQNGKRYDKAYEYNDVQIVGREYHIDVILNNGEKLYLIQETQNEYDNEAVAVCVQQNGEMIVAGYIARDNNLKSMVNDFYHRNELVTAYAEDNDKMTIGFYK